MTSPALRAAILLDFFRGMLVVGTGLLCLSALLLVSEHHWSLDPRIARIAVAGGGIENWFAYVVALVFLLFRPQGLFGEKIIDRV